MSLKIKKLSPRECFALMGMTKEDCKKCEAIGISNSQLYKIAGNGLVTNCVALIAEHMHKAFENHNYITTDEKMQESIISSSFEEAVQVTA